DQLTRPTQAFCSKLALNPGLVGGLAQTIGDEGADHRSQRAHRSVVQPQVGMGCSQPGSQHVEAAKCGYDRAVENAQRHQSQATKMSEDPQQRGTLLLLQQQSQRLLCEPSCKGLGHDSSVSTS